jgi:hypothetical protein
MNMHINGHSAGRWVHCSGSVKMIHDAVLIPQDKTIANEGVIAHDILMNMLRGDISHSNVTTDSDMLEGAQIFIDALNGLDLKKLVIEPQLTCLEISRNNKCIPDVFHFSAETNVLHVFDYKYGHRYVDVYENWQLLNYAAAIMPVVNSDENTRIVLTIVQPRSYCKDGPVRTWEISPAELSEYIVELRDSAWEIDNSAAACRAGSHCYRCPVAFSCEASRHTAMGVCDLIYDDSCGNLSDDTIGQELKILTTVAIALQARIDGLTEDIIYRIKNGIRIAGYTLTPSESRLTWNKPIAEIVALGDMLDIMLTKRQELITPAQAIKAGLNEELIVNYADRKTGALKLIETSRKLTHIFGKVDNIVN